MALAHRGGAGRGRRPRASSTSVEDELFRFGRIVGGDRELGRILSDRKASAEGKARAARTACCRARSTRSPSSCVRNVLTGPHVGTAENAVERLSEVASRRRGQSVARVTTAVPLTAAQEQRLTERARPDLRADRRPAGDRRPERARRPRRPGGRRGHRRQHRPPTRSRPTPAGRLTRPPTVPPQTTDTNRAGKRTHTMAELTISADEIRSAIQSYVTEYSPDVSREEVGTVTECRRRHRPGRGAALGHDQRAARVRERRPRSGAEPRRPRGRRRRPG